MDWTLACVILLAILIVISAISLIYNKRRYRVNSRTAVLNSLRCKKDEIKSLFQNITAQLHLYKIGKINKDVCFDCIETFYDRLIVVNKEYKDIKKQLTKEELQHEREDYDKSIDGVASLIASVKQGGK